MLSKLCGLDYQSRMRILDCHPFQVIEPMLASPIFSLAHLKNLYSNNSFETFMKRQRLNIVTFEKIKGFWPAAS